MGEADLELSVFADGRGGYGRKSDRHMDSLASQTYADGDEYIPGEFGLRRHNGVHAQRYLQLRVYVDGSLGIRQPLLQDYAVCGCAVYKC